MAASSLIDSGSTAFSSVLVGVTSAASPARAMDGIQAGIEAAEFVTDAVAYDEAFGPDSKASFNATSYTFDTFKALYSVIYISLTTTYRDTFDHGFLTVVGAPNASDRGGFVALTGWEGGCVNGAGGSSSTLRTQSTPSSPRLRRRSSSSGKHRIWDHTHFDLSSK
ncbi:hypothetical protein Hte_004263 [Hypoxylon texense]